MRTIFLFIFISFSSFYSQTISRNASSSAFANLIVPLSISSTYGSLDFGEIILTKSQFQKSIYPSSGKIFVITGQPGRGVSIMYNSITLSNTNLYSVPLGQVTTIPFSPQVVLENQTVVKNGQTINLVNNGKVGELKLYVGGIISIDANQASGLYSGNFTITVSY